MTPSVILTTLTAGLLLNAIPPQDEASKDQEKFQGTWKLVSVTREGEQEPDDHIADLILIVVGNKRTVKRGDEVVSESTFKLDPTKKPKTIDLTPTTGDLKGQTLPGIYEIDEHTQKICLGLTGERPTAFVSKQGSGHILQVFRREKK